MRLSALKDIRYCNIGIRFLMRTQLIVRTRAGVMVLNENPRQREKFTDSRFRKSLSRIYFKFLYISLNCNKLYKYTALEGGNMFPNARAGFEICLFLVYLTKFFH
jgi:hypothetical protein